MPDLAQGLTDWLLERAVDDRDFADTLSQAADRLVEGGVPVSRIALGRTLWHPLFGMIDFIWDNETRAVQTTYFQFSGTREDVETGDMLNTPFGEMMTSDLDEMRRDLRDAAVAQKYGMFQKLSADGVTDWLGMRVGVKSARNELSADPLNSEGLGISFSTKRFSGFSDADVEVLRRIRLPLSTCVRVATDRMLTTTLLETYLGRISGEKVRTGQSERGDGDVIEAVLMMSDLRNSLTLSQTLDTQTYIDTLNTYFDCIAKAVLEHGGEVLKFIGDGVLAIFPVDNDRRPRAAMCAAALAAGREAFARADHANQTRKTEDLPEINFGVALHIGEVIYGNVGADKRLDFTATGVAVGKAARLEEMTKTLGHPLLASAEFAAHCTETGMTLPAQDVRSFDTPLELIAYDPKPQFAP